MIDFSKVLEERKSDEEAAKAAAVAKRKAEWAPTAEELREAKIWEGIANALNAIGIKATYVPIKFGDINECTMRGQYIHGAKVNGEDGKLHSVWYDIRIVHETERDGFSSYRRKNNGKSRVYVEHGTGRPSIYRQDKEGNFRFADIAQELHAKAEMRKRRDAAQSQASKNSEKVSKLKEELGIDSWSDTIKPTADKAKPMMFTFQYVGTEEDMRKLYEFAKANGYYGKK